MSKASYGQIFKSTAFTGGASVVSLALGVIRTKVMAVLLGPAGIGLAGVYSTISALASTLAGMGISSSGVRQIAEAAGSGDERRIATTVLTLRRTALILGFTGAGLLAALSHPVSVLTFGDGRYAGAIAMLGLAVFFGTVAGGQAALVQGLRRIAELAQINVFGAMAGTAVGLPLIWWLGERGIVPLLVAVPATSLLVSWWFVRRVRTTEVTVPWHESASQARVLLGLGLAFMASGLMAAAVAYATRLLIVRQLGLDAAGHYAAAYALAGIYAGFILQAMGSDFYPRLTAVASDHPTVNRLVNEQTEIALLLAVPGVLGTLAFAPWVIHAFYSGGFDPAVPVLQWQVLGILGRIISWPIGFILLAKGMGKTFVLSEVLANAVHVGLVMVLLPLFGIMGAGMAFVGMYLWVTAFVFIVVWKATGFRWSRINLQMLAWMLPLVATMFAALYWLPASWSLAAGAIVTAGAGWVCLRGLVRRLPPARLGQFRFLARLA
jgi:PST family polysaccharide transporter